MCIKSLTSVDACHLGTHMYIKQFKFVRVSSGDTLSSAGCVSNADAHVYKTSQVRDAYQMRTHMYIKHIKCGRLSFGVAQMPFKCIHLSGRDTFVYKNLSNVDACHMCIKPVKWGRPKLVQAFESQSRNTAVYSFRTG
jgi:hypothetical protein